MTKQTDSLARLVRPGILALKPYSSARDEFKQEIATGPLVFLDANENSLGSPLDTDFSRYPDPHQPALKQALSERKGVTPDHIFLGNGSDEAIDLLIRAFCEPGRDEIVILPPTYGMYAVQASIQGADIRKIPLSPDFSPDLPAILAESTDRSKILFLCSPNNPTGNRFREQDVRTLLAQFPGLVVVDEAYADFAAGPSLISWLHDFPNLVVLQTFSKAWGLAGLRVGMAFANPFVIGILNKIKYPYNLNAVTISLALEALNRAPVVQEKIDHLLSERHRLEIRLSQIQGVEKIYPSEANFLLIRVRDADQTYSKLCEAGIVVRNRTREMHCANCLRITVGSPEENDRLLAALPFAIDPVNTPNT
jgi:histidinol-phosphate aminotransferase